MVGLAAAALLERLTSGGGPVWPFAKLLLVLTLMVLLLREDVTVGLALLAGAVALAVAFRVLVPDIGHAFTFGILDPKAARLHAFGEGALRISVMLFLINFTGRLLIIGGGVRILVEALERLFRDVRWVMAAIPAVIGLLPMPGGAMLSAPMVGELGDRLDMSPERKVLSNYWYRHVWEWWWPIYPAILIVLEDGYLSLPQILLYQGPLTVVAIGLGWFFLLRKVTRRRAEKCSVQILRELGRVLRVLWPILAVVIVVLTVRLPAPYKDWLLPATFLIVNVAFLFTVKLHRADFLKALRLAGQWQFFMLVFGVYVLRGVFALSGAAEKLPVGLEAVAVPPIVACFVVPFAINVLTGYSMAGVSIAFPLLAALFAGTGPSGVAVAYAGAFLGVLASPVHLCLALTREYFSARWGRVYALLTPMLLGMLATVVLIAWIG